ncbi:MCP four helix bundle domain-containing protein, partial [bacterium]|nr:MCP four helix bundle domain-containing protein [bacterium]
MYTPTSSLRWQNYAFDFNLRSVKFEKVGRMHELKVFIMHFFLRPIISLILISLFFVNCNYSLILGGDSDQDIEQSELQDESSAKSFQKKEFDQILSRYDLMSDLSTESALHLISKSDFEVLDQGRKKTSYSPPVHYKVTHSFIGLSFYLLIFFSCSSLMVALLVRTQFYRNFGISAKLTSGFSYVIFVAVMIALVGVYSLDNVSKEADLSSKISELSELASEFEALQYKFVVLAAKDHSLGQVIFEDYKKSADKYLNILSEVSTLDLDEVEQKIIKSLKSDTEKYTQSFIKIEKSFSDVSLLAKNLAILGEEMKEFFGIVIEIHEIELEDLEFAETPDKEVIYLQTLLVEDLFRAETWLLKLKLQDNGFLLEKS